MKLLELEPDSCIWDMVNTEIHFGFVHGRGTTDTIFIVPQLQDKYIAATKLLYFAFVDFEKALDLEPRKVLWRALRSLGVENWAVYVTHGMYSNVWSQIWSIVSTMRSLVWELVCITALPLAHCSASYLSSTLVCRGSFFTDDRVLVLYTH